MPLRTCVDPAGSFLYGIHKPSYEVKNLRQKKYLSALGKLDGGGVVDNSRNFPSGDLVVESADWVYEIPNPFPFRGTTFINKSWADRKAATPESIALPEPPEVSFSASLRELLGSGGADPAKAARAFQLLPTPVLLALAATSTDAADLEQLAGLCCSFVHAEETGRPAGLRHEKDSQGRIRPAISNHELFETLVNNVHLPDDYKEVMVLRPGVQGGSEIVGEYGSGPGNNHVFEYLRRNSYIPWGHYASNMANDTIRYRVQDLTMDDITGLRHLYYQRTYVKMAGELGIALPAAQKVLCAAELEELRGLIMEALSAAPSLRFNRTLWGWNFGFDYAPSGYRLHASHQQIHQQFALLPAQVPAWHRHGKPAGAPLSPYGCGDLVAEFCREYKQETGRNFFAAYIEAIRANRRLDGREKGEHSLIVHEDERVILFVPKAQTSQWELQIMTLDQVGNILEADTQTRQSLDRALLLAQKLLAAMGARLVTVIEYPKRFDADDSDQRLLYALLPKLPQSPGAFSEAQLRWINGHYPEDFAVACRAKLAQITGI